MNEEILFLDNGVYYVKEHIYIFNDEKHLYLKSSIYPKDTDILFKFSSLQQASNIADSLSSVYFPSLKDFKYNHEESMYKFNRVEFWKQCCNFLVNYESNYTGVDLTQLLDHVIESRKEVNKKMKEPVKSKRKHLLDWFRRR